MTSLRRSAVIGLMMLAGTCAWGQASKIPSAQAGPESQPSSGEISKGRLKLDEMIKALTATNGHYSQFTGDGLMALYGLSAKDPAIGAADALRGAREMLARVAQLNSRMRGDLPQPIRIAAQIIAALQPENRRHTRARVARHE